MRLTQSSAPGARLGPGNFIVGVAVLLLFGGLPGYFALRGWREIRLDERLEANGVAVRAVVTEKNASVDMAGLHPIRYSFTYEGKPYDAGALVPDRQFGALSVGGEIDILVMPGDPSLCSPTGRALSKSFMTSIAIMASIAGLCGAGLIVMLVGLVRGNYSAGTFLVRSRDLSEGPQRSSTRTASRPAFTARSEPSPAFRYARFAVLAVILVAAALTIGRDLLRTGSRARTAVSQQQASSDEKLLELWELHPGDRVLFVTAVYHGGASQLVRSGSPYLLPDSHMLREAPIGGTVVTVEERTMPSYRGRSYTMRDYTLAAGSDPTGMVMLIEGLPHVHRRGEERLFSLGNDPQDRRARRIVCVAVPFEDATARSVDFAPFAQRRVGDWRVFFFDTTSIRRHVSIHVQYRPGAEHPSLDWQELAPPEWNQPSPHSPERPS